MLYFLNIELWKSERRHNHSRRLTVVVLEVLAGLTKKTYRTGGKQVQRMVSPSVAVFIYLFTECDISPHLAPVAWNNLPVCQDVHIHASFATETVRSIIIVNRINLCFGFVKVLLAHVTVI